MYNSHNCKHWRTGDKCCAGIGPDDKHRESVCWASYGLTARFNYCFEEANDIDRYEGKRKVENEL